MLAGVVIFVCALFVTALVTLLVAAYQIDAQANAARKR
jgi:hypothetical protein